MNFHKHPRMFLKLLFLFTFLMGCVLANAQSSYNPKGPILIRPFGDSITLGYGFLGPADAEHPERGWDCPVYWPNVAICQWPLAYGGGYRGWMTLYALQTQEITFTTEGYQSNGSYWQQWLTDSHAHDGYPGARTDELVRAANLASTSDVTLVHAGTNDIFQKYRDTAEDTYLSLVKLINSLLQHNSKTQVFVAQIIPFAPPVSTGDPRLNKWVTTYNNSIDTKLVQDLPANLKSRVTIVDMQNILDPDQDYFDGVHPNYMGYQKMACVWIKAIQSSQNPCPTGTLESILEKMGIPAGGPPALPSPENMPPGIFPNGFPGLPAKP